MINNLGGRLPKCRVGIIAESHDAGIRDLLGKKVFQPELLGLRVCPGGESVAAKAMDGHDTVARWRQRAPSNDRTLKLMNGKE